MAKSTRAVLECCDDLTPDERARWTAYYDFMDALDEQLAALTLRQQRLGQRAEAAIFDDLDSLYEE